MATVAGFVDRRTERVATPSVAWLVVGVALSLVSLGARWDIPLAAWFAPIFLLRFTRRSPMPLALAGIVLAFTAQAMGLILSYGIPLIPV